MAQEVRVRFSAGIKPLAEGETPGVLIVGQMKHLLQVDFDLVKPKLPSQVSEEVWKEGLSKLNPTNLDSIPVYFNNVVIASLPAQVSRHNTPSRAHSIAKIVKSNSSLNQIVIVCEDKDMYASGCAVGRCFPLYSRKTSDDKKKPRGDVNVEFLVIEGGKAVSPNLDASAIKLLDDSCNSIQLTAKLLDVPANELTSDAFVEEVRKVEAELKEYGVTSTIIRGEDLREGGFGGIYGVGKASVYPPALAVLKYNPKDAKRSIAWVGKGIIYDTGGLSIKGKTFMPGMKHDCGGAAAVLGAFQVAVKAGFKDNLYGVMCIAENSVGPNATRPDDIHTMYSGKTVEINNTDAEGRLVLADGVYYAWKDLGAEIILDIATLTGAQGISTGKYHAAHMSNSEEWEHKVFEAGKSSGDLSFPVVYCPEMQFPEFKSVVADMKNSVASRSNAQPSCAGLFINAHLGFQFPGVWIHVDMAAPSAEDERGTGYGVSLLNTLFGDSSSSGMLQNISPANLS